MSGELLPMFRALPLGAVTPGGWLREQMKRDLREGFAQQLDLLTNHAANDLFRQRIGQSNDEIAWWDSETRGNWLWGLTMMAYLADDAEAIAKVEAMIADLKATQDDDGYLGIYVPGARYQHSGENGELWAQSRALLVLLAHYGLTGDETSLQAVERAAKLTMRQYGAHHPYFNRPGADYIYSYSTGVTHGLNYVDVVEWLYALTGDVAYRDWGVWLYQDFSSVPGRFINDDFKLKNLLHMHISFSGHAAHTAEHLRVLIFAYSATGDPELGRALENAFAKYAFYTVPSGALIGDESVHGTAHPEMGYEYCTMCELLVSLASALQKFGDSRYGDWLENLAFNAGQGARLANGKAICYLSVENRLEAVDTRPDAYQINRFRGARYKYSPTHEDIAVCCNPNAVRFLPHYVSRMWMKTADGAGIAACLYGASTVQTEVGGVRVRIDEQTDYPFTDSVTFIITPDAEVEFPLLLRKPRWMTGMDITAPGAVITEDDHFFIVRKRWCSGDTVSVTFQQRVEAVLNVNGEYSVRRGALQYVLPIAHREVPLKSYPVEGFYDLNLLPLSAQQAYTIPFLDVTQPDLGLSLVGDEESDRQQPWERAPIRLQNEAMTLVPMGCTVLRRATLPASAE
jgi:hypothetical protein